MLGINRSRIGQIGLAFAAGLAALSGGGLWHWANSEEAEYQVAAEQDARYEASAARKNARSECAIADMSSTDCSDRIEQAAKDAQEETRDLEAQQTMAVWTKAMGLAAVIGMSVGILSLGLIFFTFRETRRGAQTARDNLNAFYESERAIVHAVAGRVGTSNKREGEYVVFEFRNKGRSPARIVRMGGNLPSNNTAIENAEARWTIIPVDGSVFVIAFPVPPKDVILETECWVEYRSVGPEIYTSFFEVIVKWREERSTSLIFITPAWEVTVANTDGHPKDT